MTKKQIWYYIKEAWVLEFFNIRNMRKTFKIHVQIFIPCFDKTCKCDEIVSVQKSTSVGTFCYL